MDYSTMLRQMVTRSSLSLREIAYRCRSERNVPLDPSYISKLQSGKQAPPAEDISRAIAEVCGGDADSLIFQGYMDHAPRVIVDLVQSIETMMRTFYDSIARSSKTPPEMLALLEKQLCEMTTYSLLRELPAAFQFQLDPDDDSVILPGPEGQTLLQFASPSLGIDPPMPDDSMEPLIPTGAKLAYKRETEYRDGDVVLIQLGSGYTARKMLHVGDQIILLAINSRFKSLALGDNADVKIIGRVVSAAHDIPRS